MRVLIASAPHADTFGYSMPPPGLLRLGGALRDLGIDVRLEDLAFRLGNDDLEPRRRLACTSARWLLRNGAPDVLGLSVMGATTPIAIAIAREVRSRSSATRIVLGGPGTTGIDVQLLERFGWLDAVCRGEAELGLAELLERWDARDDPRGISGITWREEDGRVRREADRRPLADLGALPEYARELLPDLEAYQRIAGAEEGLVPIDSGRGCVYDCSFCTIGRYWNRRSRELPPGRLVDEVLELKELPGAKAAYLCHDLFGANRAHALAFCAELEARGADVPWECRARIDHLDAELLLAMGRAGCYRVLLGVESADPGVRAANQKGMAADVDVVRVVSDCARAGISPILSFILGLPGEGESELRATLDLAHRCSLAAGVHLSLHLVNPQPGCELGTRYAAVSRPVAGIPPDMALGTGDTAEERELIEAHPDLFSSFAVLVSLPGGEAHLRRLYTIAQGLPPLLMHYPRTLALAAQAAGVHALELFEREGWKLDELPRVAREHSLPEVRDAYRLERALASAPAEGTALVHVQTDPDTWLAPRPPSERARGPAWLAVQRRGTRVRTLRLSPALANLLRSGSVSDPETADELQRRGLLPTRDIR